MKRISCIGLLFALFFTFATPTSAQRRYNDYRAVSFGVKGGATLSKVNFRPSVREGFLPGMTAGASVRYIEEKYFGLQAELNFSQLGWDEVFEESPYRFSRTFNYLELPFMAHIYFGNKRVRGYINLGPQFGYMIGESYSSNFDVYDPPANSGSVSSTEEQYTEEVGTRFDYGICGGAGFEIHAGKSAFLIEARYYFGLGDVFANRKKDTFSTSSNSAICVGIGYLFNLK